jgi:hypothetical protein
MKDAVLTIRLSTKTRRRLETAARRDGRSLSDQAARLIEQGLGGAGAPPARLRVLSGVFVGAGASSFGDFREVRSVLSASLRRRVTGRAQRRR